MKTLMFSGGLDSACAFYVLGKPHCLYCGGEYGPARVANVGEALALQSMVGLDPSFQAKLKVKIFDWHPFMREGQHTLPRENLLAIAAWATGRNTVLYAWTQNDTQSLQRIEHMKQVTCNAVDMPGFETDFPVWKLYRHELIIAALRAGAHPLFLQTAWSCVQRSDVHCGQCVNCCERFLAMRYAAIEDVEYATDPQKSGVMENLISRNSGNDRWSEQLHAKRLR